MKNLLWWPKTAIDQDALRAQPNMTHRRKKSWRTFKKEMKAKRRKTVDGGGKKNEKWNILERQLVVVQRLSSKESGKAQKYTRVGPHEFVQYDPGVGSGTPLQEANGNVPLDGVAFSQLE